MSEDNIFQNAPTPKTNLIEHFQNFGEAGMYFSGSLGLALATVYFRQLEIVLAIGYSTELKNWMLSSKYLICSNLQKVIMNQKIV